MANEDTKKLAVVIVTYNVCDLLKRCLLSLQKNLHNIPHEICVADNASVDGTVAMLRKDFPEVQVIENTENRGFSVGINQGIRATRAPYVVWVNSDAELMDDRFIDLIEYFEKNPEVGILGPKIVYPNGSLQHSVRTFPSYENYFFGRTSLLTRLFPNNPFSRKYLSLDFDYSAICDADWVSGAVFLHRRVLADKIGLLDERFFIYFEEVDFCKRAHENGWKVQFHPGTCFLHHLGGTTKKMKVKMLTVAHQSNWRYYKKHFQGNLIKDAVVATGLFLRWIIKITLSLFDRE